MYHDTLTNPETNLGTFDPSAVPSNPSAIPSNPSAVPSNPSDSPSNPSDNPSNSSAVPSSPSASPRHPSASPSNLSASPSNPNASPSTPIAFPSNHSASPSNAIPDTPNPSSKMDLSGRAGLQYTNPSVSPSNPSASPLGAANPFSSMDHSGMDHNLQSGQAGLQDQIQGSNPVKDSSLSVEDPTFEVDHLRSNYSRLATGNSFFEGVGTFCLIFCFFSHS